MTLREIRSDIILILQKSKVSKDSRILERHIQFLIQKYYSVGVRQRYQSSQEIDPAWLLDTGRILFTTITSAEDAAVPVTNLMFGKYTLPSQVVSLPDDIGLYRVGSSARMVNYLKESASFFLQFQDTPGSDFKNFDYCFRIGQAIYTYPNAREGNIIFIAEEPLNVPVLLTENVTSLVVGTRYKVVSGSIVTSGNTYTTGTVFTATATTFTGSGMVQYAVQKRQRTLDDYFPASASLAEMISMKIFTQDFHIETQQVADIKNDVADQLSVLQKNP